MTKRASDKEKKKLPPIKCKGCVTKFIPKTKKQKYHSENCRIQYYEQHYFAKIDESKTCPNCDVKFHTSTPGKQVYCTPECRKDAARKRAEGVIASVHAERTTYLTDRHLAMKRDGFRCTLCGRGPQDGAILGVEPDDKGGLKTVCNECKEGEDSTKR